MITVEPRQDRSAQRNDRGRAWAYDPDMPDTDSPRPTPPAVVIAGDIGATSSRIQVARAEGERGLLAEADGPGANLRSSGPQALDHLAQTVRRALADAAARLEVPPRIAAVALGVSGAGPSHAAQVRDLITGRLAELGIDPASVQVGDDLRTAFLSGGVGDDGILLLSGTGAVTVLFRGREGVARRDGMGWLLGDIGSAVWLGRRTLQAVAADLDQRGRRTVLTERVGEMLDLDLRAGRTPPSPTGDVRQDLIRALDELAPASSPAALGRFAPLPGTVPEDPAAREILDTATRHFTDTVRALDPQLTLPVVLAGSVLASPGPIHDEVVIGLEADGREHRTAASGLPGALLLAREAAAAAGTSGTEQR